MLGELRGRWPGGRLLAALFVAVLVAGAMSSGIVMAGAGPSGTVAVSSEPSGATVKVDNVVRGVTPLELRDLAPGSHRVAVAKAGYLENMRVVEVVAGGTLNLDVKLTATSVPAQETPAVQEHKSGSKLKWILPLAGGGAIGAVLLMRSSNSPPVAGSISVTPPGMGIAAVTSFGFTSQGASDPNGDPLSYSWDFGDGSNGSGSSVSHIFSNAGSYTVTLRVSDGKASATASSYVHVVSLGGTWSGSIGCYTNTIRFTWTQNGSTLSGTFFDSYNGSGSSSGTVSNPSSISVQTNIYGFRIGNWSGTVDGTGNSIAGTTDWYSCGTTTFHVTRQ